MISVAALAPAASEASQPAAVVPPEAGARLWAPRPAAGAPLRSTLATLLGNPKPGAVEILACGVAAFSLNRNFANSRVLEMPPRPVRGTACEPRTAAAQFAPNGPLLPRPAAAEGAHGPAGRWSLEPCSFEAAVPPRECVAAVPSCPRLASSPLDVTTGIERGGAQLVKQSQFMLAGAGPAAVAGAGARRFDPVPRAVADQGFAMQQPEPPASRGIRAAGRLAHAPVLLPARPAAALSREPQPAAVALTLSEELKLPGAQKFCGGHRLGSAGPESLATQPPACNPAPRSAPWHGFGEAVPAFAFAGMRLQGLRWPLGTAEFASLRPIAASQGPIGKAAPPAAPGFSIGPICCPLLPERGRILGQAPPAGLPGAIARDASGTARQAHPAVYFRLSRRPSRLPVFRTQTVRAQMPAGAFSYIEQDDRDDERTFTLAPSCEAAAPGWRIPGADFAPRSRELLAETGFTATAANAAPGAPVAAGAFGERPYRRDLCYPGARMPVLEKDFETMVETHEPRWRSALKTASGLFRGALPLLACLLVAGTLFSGCSKNRGSLRSNLQNRAAVRLEHDFSQGLDGWYGGRDWAARWVRDQPAGYVRAGQLALYRPSQHLADYRMEFLGQIDGTNLGWIYRAADLQNYYVSKLVVATPGPLPVMALDRYQVLGGRETRHVRIPIRMVLHNNRPYRIRQDVRGNAFTTSIEGEVVDFYTDDRLRTGAIGFLGDPGGAPHLYWVRVAYQDDLWGRLCAAIAPR
ncbi:MAG TPA: hypothetical protein VHA11_12125 [Bryobacteraceae bacterium]|nr:hypothetical protein [Bryobacteraceae bacterium]